jgi:hypothetical protein
MPGGPISVLQDEDDDGAIEVHDPQGLLDAVHAKARLRRGLGRVLVRCEPAIRIYVTSSLKTLPFEGNMYSMALEGSAPAGNSAGDWLAAWFEAAVGALNLRYANGYSDEERESKNIVNDSEGYRAVGVDFHTALPGLYWLNFFGPEYVALIGKGRLLSAPAHRALEFDTGIFLQMHANADEWSLPQGIAGEQKVEAHLGAQYFFSKRDPSRRTIAPDFWIKP